MLFDELNDIYKARSALVHGRKPWAYEKIESAATKARRIAGGLLMKALTQGWPTQEQLQAAALGTDAWTT